MQAETDGAGLPLYRVGDDIVFNPTVPDLAYLHGQTGHVESLGNVLPDGEQSYYVRVAGYVVSTNARSLIRV